MIRSLTHHVSQPATLRSAATPSKAAHPAAKNIASTVDFRKLMQPAAVSTPVTPDPSPDEVPHLGPFKGDPYMHPVVPAPKPPDPITSSPWMPAGTVGDQNLMNKAEHESTMNSWLQNYTKWSNDNKTQIYQQAMANWQLNDQRCQELGLAAPPKPTPPTLDPVQPMATGYWFQ
jgi:hypothetical protein